MAVEVSTGTPLAEELHKVVLPKLANMGWSTGGMDDAALAEYIILMLANGSTQDQIASEISNDLLDLAPDDPSIPSVTDFANWLFGQVETINNQLNGSAVPMPIVDVPLTQNEAPQAMEQDAEMGDVADGAQGSIPTGPKSMRNG
ncbi:hypothetical protein LTS18_005795, partial [Coniosporium uncinatum]